MKYLIAFLALFFVAACEKCEDGLVGSGPVKMACPWCDGKTIPSVGFQDRDSLVAAENVSAPSSAARLAATTEARMDSVVRIVVPEKDGKRAGGSGVVVEHDGKVLILTAAHVTEGRAGDPTIHFPGGATAIGRVVKEDRPWDIAAIECDKCPVAPIVLGPRPGFGETLILCGYGSSPYKYQESKGKIVALWRPRAGMPNDHFEMTSGARDGDSGGPVFNEKGEVAGILFGSKDGHTWATHSGRVAMFLADEKPQTARAKPSAECPTGKCPKR